MKKLLTVALCVVALGLGALLGMAFADRVRQAPANDGVPAPTSGEKLAITVYKSPTCGCCSDWVRHLEAHGFAVTVHDSERMNEIKAEARVPGRLSSCHTAFIGDYVIEGHVPAADIERLLKDQPAAAGLAVPGMPLGSPGMEMGSRRDPYEVLLFQEDGSTQVFNRYGDEA